MSSSPLLDNNIEVTKIGLGAPYEKALTLGELRRYNFEGVQLAILYSVLVTARTMLPIPKCPS